MTPIQFYLKEINSRIAKHEADEKQNPARLQKLKEERRAIALTAAGMKDGDDRIKSVDIGEIRYSDSGDVKIRLRSRPRISHTITVSGKLKKLAANRKKMKELMEQQKRGCVECDQLRALIDTGGVNGFSKFMRSRYGKDFTHANAQEALPDWLRLRAPAACPVLQ